MVKEKEELTESAVNNLSELLSDVSIPMFRKVKYSIESRSIENVSAQVKECLLRKGALDRIESGSKVAVTVGSREINNLDVMLLALISELKKKGAHPFIVPAMGSHGGATAKGQQEVIENFGITEEKMGVQIKASMETVCITQTPSGIPVHVDKNALSADYIIPMGRIKPHTDFKGRFESGLMKMMAIGLGKQKGASICHKLGMENMSENVHAIGKEVLKHCSIPFGIGIIENAFHGTWKIEAIPAEKIEAEEPKLLDEAKGLVPKVPFEKVDIIICEEMGKDISGTGMDSNVIGRSASLGISRPFAERIGVFALTQKSHGNANGMGLADCITKRFYNNILFDQTYPNAITSAETTAVKMPAMMESDEQCVRFLIKTCTGSGPDGIRIVWMKNTLSMDSFYISEGLINDIIEPGLELVDKYYSPKFDEKGSFISFKRSGA